jgi:hypothetical protein
MNYVIAGYSIVLSILFLYGVQLVWRRRRLTRAVARVEAITSGLERVDGADGAVGPERIDEASASR